MKKQSFRYSLRRLLSLLTLLAVLLGIGTSYVRSVIADARLSRIQIGMTVEQVRAIAGEPEYVRRYPDGTHDWVYFAGWPKWLTLHQLGLQISPEGKVENSWI